MYRCSGFAFAQVATGNLDIGEVSRQDAGCEQFEVFQSVSDPDKLVLLELWKDQAALDAHAKLQAQRPPLPEGLRLGAGEREVGIDLSSHYGIGQSIDRWQAT